jgi:hypothetical protein
MACKTTTRILSAIGDIECAITAGPDLCCHTALDGTIVIITRTETITIQLRRTIDRERLPVENADKRLAHEAKEGSDCEEEHTESDQEDREHDIHATNGYRSNPIGEAGGKKKKKDKTKNKRKRKTLMSKEEVAQFCTGLATKIVGKWEDRSTTWEESKNELLADPSTFFGKCTSLIQWSYQTLDSSEKKRDRFHLPFHKINLFFWWKQCAGAGNEFKRSMYEAVKPGFTNLPEKKKDSIRIQIARYVNQGEVFCLMYKKVPGLLITIPHFITTKE